MREDAITRAVARLENAIREAHDSHPICNQSGYALGYDPEPTGGDGWWMTVADLRTVLAALREARADVWDGVMQVAKAVARHCDSDVEFTLGTDNFEALDAYAEAVRAETLDAVAARVGEALQEVPAKHSGTVAEDFKRARNRTIHTVLATITAMKGER